MLRSWLSDLATGIAMLLAMASGPFAAAQTFVVLDNVPPIPLPVSAVAFSIDHVTGNVVLRSQAGNLNQCTQAGGAAPVINAFSPISATVTPGATITLIWNSSNATSCSPALGAGTIWSSLGTLPTSGSRSFTAPASVGTITFQLNCTDGSTAVSASTQVNVLNPPPLPAITAFFPTSASVIAGSPITLNWTAGNATSCTPALGGSTAWSAQGALPISGSRSVAAPQNAGSIIFQLYCTNGAQSVSAMTTVNVTPGNVPLINWFYPSLASVTVGAQFNLIWNASNATSCTPSLGTGTVWGSLGALPTGGLRTLTAPQVSGPISFQLSCTNGAQSVIATTQVTVNANNPPMANLTAASSAVSCETAFRPNVVSFVVSSTNAAYCLASESEPRRTNWTQISCRPCAQNDPTCGPPVVCPDATDLKKLPPNQTAAVTIFNDQAGPGSGTPTTLQLTCFASIGGASASSNRPLTLVQDSNPGVCELLATATYVPSPATTAPSTMPDGSVTVQASVSNPQGLQLSASVLQQPQFGDVTVAMVGDTVTLRYYPHSGDSPRVGVVTETVQVIIVNGGSGVPVTYTFEVDLSLFSNGFEGGAPGIPTLEETFEGVSGNPACPSSWQCLNLSSPAGKTSWFQGNSTIFPAQSGGPDSYLAANFENASATGTISNWLVSPPVTFTGGNELRFWTRGLGRQWADRLEIRASTTGGNPGTTATSVGDFSILLGTVNPSLIVGSGNCTTPAASPGNDAYPAQWCEYRISNLQGLPTSGNGRIAFRYQVTDGGPSGSNSDYIGIDTVRLGPAQ